MEDISFALYDAGAEPVPTGGFTRRSSFRECGGKYCDCARQKGGGAFFLLLIADLISALGRSWLKLRRVWALEPDPPVAIGQAVNSALEPETDACRCPVATGRGARGETLA